MTGTSRTVAVLLIVTAAVAGPAAADAGSAASPRWSPITAAADDIRCQESNGPWVRPKELTHLTLRTASGPRYAEIVLSRPLSVQESDGGIDSCGNPAVFTWTGCGRYRGFLFQPLGPDPAGAATVAFGLLDVAGFRTPLASGHRMPVPLASRAIPNGLRLAAGRYRVHVLCEGRGEVRIPVLKADLPRSRVVDASHRSAFTYRESPVRVETSLGVSAPVGVLPLPLPVDGGSAYVGAVTHTYVEGYPMPLTGGYAAVAALTDVCVDGLGNLDVANACDAASRYGRHTRGRQGAIGSDGRVSQDDYLVYQPGGMPEGSHTSFHTVAAAGTRQEGVAASFVLRP